MDNDTYILYEQYLGESLQDWFKAMIAGTLIAVGTNCATSPTKCRPDAYIQNANKQPTNPWYDFYHPWLDVPNIKYSPSLINAIKKQYGNPPDPYEYAQNAIGNNLWLRALNEYNNKIEKFNVEEWIRRNTI